MQTLFVYVFDQTKTDENIDDKKLLITLQLLPVTRELTLTFGGESECDHHRVIVCFEGQNACLFSQF